MLGEARRSGSHAKNDVHDAFDFTETVRAEVEGHLDVFVVLPGELEGEACGCELNEPQTIVAGVGIMIEGLDVADAPIIVLELTLNEKVGLIGGRKIQVIVAGVLVIERDLEIFIAGLSDGHMFGVESHRRRPWFSAFPSLTPIARRAERPPQGNRFALRIAAATGPVDPPRRRPAQRNHVSCQRVAVIRAASRRTGSVAHDPKETLDVQCNRLSGCRTASIRPS
jgi:hypothetical protein